MSETDHRTAEPHVSTEELRAALTPRGETRRNPVLVVRARRGPTAGRCAPRSRPPTASQAELEASRRLIDSARADSIELRASRRRPRATPTSCGSSSQCARAPRPPSAARPSASLAGAGIFRRRRVMAQLKARNAF